MYEMVKDENGLGLTAGTVRELKTMLENIPDDYLLTVTGTVFAMAVDHEEKVVLLDEPDYILGLTEEGKDMP